MDCVQEPDIYDIQEWESYKGKKAEHDAHLTPPVTDIKWLDKNVVTPLHTTLSSLGTAGSVEKRLVSLNLRGSNTEDKYIQGAREERTSPGGHRCGTLSVYLPTTSGSGVTVHLTYQGKKQKFVTKGRDFTISTIGLYTGVQQTVDPIKAGFVVSLEYELLFTGKGKIPCLPSFSHTFWSWRKALDGSQGLSSPNDLILCLLNRKIKHDSDSEDDLFQASSLTRTDLDFLLSVAPWAKGYGFDLHFADVTYTEKGCVVGDYYDSEDSEDYYSFKNVYRGCAYDAPIDKNPDNLEMERVDGHSLTLSNVVALDGMPMMASGAALKEISRSDQSIFSRGDILNGFRSSKVIRIYGEKMLHRSYTAKALIVSPKGSPRLQFQISPARFPEFAMAVLSSDYSDSEEPTAREKQLSPLLMDWLQKNVGKPSSDKDGLKQAANTLRQCAERWQDVQLFVRILQICGPEQVFRTVGVDGLVYAYQAFDWEDIEPMYSEAFSREPSNRMREQLINRLLETATDPNARQWCETQRDTALLGAFTKLQVNEIEWAFKYLESCKEPTQTLRDVLIPRLHTAQPDDMNIWSAMLARLSQLVSDQGKSSKLDRTVIPDIIEGCLQRIAGTMNPFPVAEKVDTFGDRVSEANVDPIVSLVELCVQYRVTDVPATLFQRMWDTRKRASCPCAVQYYWCLLTKRFGKLIDKNVDIKKTVALAFRHATEIFLESYNVYGASAKEALPFAYDPFGDLIYCLSKKSLSLKNTEDLVNFVSKKLRRQATTPESQAKLNEVLQLCHSRRSLKRSLEGDARQPKLKKPRVDVIDLT
ncbi:hypothetical protein VNI00_016006 [Paramarasmius palmivorus]|uniref:Uncharacterized protein n=1 Tax=Paramarasmius palmivorus TaxID=297713 RepID=A0AAW0BHX8_9AGAR